MDLNQVTIGSTDVARSMRFYQQLGLRLIVDNTSLDAYFGERGFGVTIKAGCVRGVKPDPEFVAEADAEAEDSKLLDAS